MAAIWLFIKTLGGNAVSAASGFSLRTWAIIGAVLAILLLTWLAYCWAWDRGAASQQAIIDQKQARIDILAGDVLTLQAGIEDRNRQIEAYAAKERENAARAAKLAEDALAALTVARKREAARGAGPDAMNSFFSDILGGAQ